MSLLAARGVVSTPKSSSRVEGNLLCQNVSGSSPVRLKQRHLSEELDVAGAHATWTRWGEWKESSLES